MPARVPGAAVRERARQVRTVGAALTPRFRRSQVGTVHRSLAIEDGSLVVTGNYLKVRLPPGARRNDWLDVRIADAGDSGSSLTGEIVGRSG
jgi:hypothetical protein